MSNFLWKKKKKVNNKKNYADRPYLIFLAMLVDTKNFFFTPKLKFSSMFDYVHSM